MTDNKLLDFQRFPIEYGGRDYVMEFDRESFYRTDEGGAITGDGVGIIDRTFRIFYCSLIKNHPHITIKNAKKMFEELIDPENGDYSLEDFSDTIVDEYTRLMSIFFTKSGKAKKKIVAEKKIVQMPTTEKK